MMIPSGPWPGCADGCVDVDDQLTSLTHDGRDGGAGHPSIRVSYPSHGPRP